MKAPADRTAGSGRRQRAALWLGFKAALDLADTGVTDVNNHPVWVRERGRKDARFLSGPQASCGVTGFPFPHPRLQTPSERFSGHTAPSGSLRPSPRKVTERPRSPLPPSQTGFLFEPGQCPDGESTKGQRRHYTLRAGSPGQDSSGACGACTGPRTPGQTAPRRPPP